MVWLSLLCIACLEVDRRVRAERWPPSSAPSLRFPRRLPSSHVMFTFEVWLMSIVLDYYFSTSCWSVYKYSHFLVLYIHSLDLCTFLYKLGKYTFFYLCICTYMNEYDSGTVCWFMQANLIFPINKHPNKWSYVFRTLIFPRKLFFKLDIITDQFWNNVLCI